MFTLTSRQWQQQSTQCTKHASNHAPHEAIGSLGCSHMSFMFTQAYQSGPQPQRRTLPLILSARKTRRPLCSLGIAWHCSQPAKPIALQATAAEPLVNPSRQTGAQACVWAKYISNRPTSCGRTGAPLAPIKRSSPSKKAPVVLVPQNTTESLAWLKQASSGASCLHSFKLISVPAHCKAFAATGEPLAPQKLAPATQHQTQSQSVGKPRWPPDCSGHIPYHIHLPPFPSPASQHGRPRQEQQQASRQHQQRLDKKPAQTILKACISLIKINPFQNGAPEQEQKVATGLKQRTQHHTLHAEPLREKAFEKSMRPSSLHIGCARSAQRACAKRVRQHASTLYLQTLTSRQRQQQSAQCTKHASNQASPKSLWSDWQSWLLPHEFHAHTGLPIGSPTPAQDSATDSFGAQNTSSPVLIGHCVTLLSDPAHAKAETWGGTFPHTLPEIRQNDETWAGTTERSGNVEQMWFQEAEDETPQ